MKDLYVEIMEYEDGELDENEILELFSKLIKNGMVWGMGGNFARTADGFIGGGYLDTFGNILKR
jgi:hypothetical protein